MKMIHNCKILSSNVPVDINNLAVTGDYVSMKGYNHLTIILHFGVVGTGTALTLKQAKDVAATGEKALAFKKVYINEGLTTDTLTETAVTSDSYTVASTNSNLYVVEIDSSELDVDNDFDCVRFDLAAGAGTTLLSALCILSVPRYGTTVSAILD